MARDASGDCEQLQEHLPPQSPMAARVGEWHCHASPRRDGEAPARWCQVWLRWSLHPCSRNETGLWCLLLGLVGVRNREYYFKSLCLCSIQLLFLFKTFVPWPPCLQFCGGTSFISKVVESLQPTTEIPTVLLDLFGFDAWPGCYAIAQSARGPLGSNMDKPIFSPNASS